MSQAIRLCGQTALSEFRIKKLLQQVKESGLPENLQLRTEYWFFVETESSLTAQEKQKLKQLLDASSSPERAKSALCLVVPRFGTVSPWSSKATEIIHNCGLKKVNRIERGMAYGWTVWIIHN